MPNYPVISSWLTTGKSLKSENKDFLPAFLLAEEVPVTLHQFTNEQEGINGSDAVANQIGNEFPFGV